MIATHTNFFSIGSYFQTRGIVFIGILRRKCDSFLLYNYRPSILIQLYFDDIWFRVFVLSTSYFTLNPSQIRYNFLIRNYFSKLYRNTSYLLLLCSIHLHWFWSILTVRRNDQEYQWFLIDIGGNRFNPGVFDPFATRYRFQRYGDRVDTCAAHV